MVSRRKMTTSLFWIFIIIDGILLLLPYGCDPESPSPKPIQILKPEPNTDHFAEMVMDIIVKYNKITVSSIERSDCYYSTDSGKTWNDMTDISRYSDTYGNNTSDPFDYVAYRWLPLGDSLSNTTLYHIT